MSWQAFHGFTAVAELKPRAGVDLATAQKLTFHGFTAVAELKLARRRHVGGDRATFHGFTAVAELKLGGAERLIRENAGLSTASPPWPN